MSVIVSLLFLLNIFFKVIPPFVKLYTLYFAEQSASVFGVAKYDKQSQLGLGVFGNEDAIYFATKLVSNPSWNSVKSKFNADVTPTALNNGKYDDFVHSTGHGSTNGCLALKAYAGSNQPAESYVNWIQ
ncbi:hypothetical protein GC093_29855 [Paenibacillus sp. LMG 31456]|uniref:Uncharacterized protein n=1 Tax=Paenibacillus foliorum TaxID=2654974 RepID=A0A972K3W4_9BACL|nr:hypothetical protein [Paenibacillus foliorum]NOU97405.1 hypothetical protein [Paenibacillus foliorum]